MATVTLGKKVSEDLQRDVSKLLGRGRAFIQPPVKIPVLQEFWNNMLDPQVVNAYHVIKDAKMSTDSMLERTVHIHLPDIKIIFVSTYDLELQFLELPGGKRELEGATLEQLEAAWPAKSDVPFSDFMQWTHNSAVIERDFPRALQILSDILSWCSTIGQLNRAVPDLVRYLPQEKQELLRSQGRPSNMPHEWALFDRSRIEHLQVCMAKAYLMPGQNQLWESLDVSRAYFGNIVRD